MKPSDIFLELLELGAVPHGHERVYKPILESYGFVEDGLGNWYKAGTIPVLLTAHLDTAHNAPGPTPYKRTGPYVQSTGDGPLGADDKAGVALILYLSQQQLPVSMALFAGEEVGMVGSQKAAQAYSRNRWVLQDLTAVVSLDRKGTTDVVVSQMGYPCAMYAFAQELIAQLPLEITAEGIYTDSYAFVDFVPNATNLSVGYYNAHTPKEAQDLHFLDKMGEALLWANWERISQVSKEHPIMPRQATPEELAQRLYTLLSMYPHLLPDFVYDLVYTYPDFVSRWLEVND